MLSKFVILLGACAGCVCVWRVAILGCSLLVLRDLSSLATAFSSKAPASVLSGDSGVAKKGVLPVIGEVLIPGMDYGRPGPCVASKDTRRVQNIT